MHRLEVIPGDLFWYASIGLLILEGDKENTASDILHLLAHDVWAGLSAYVALFPAHDLHKAAAALYALPALDLGSVLSWIKWRALAHKLPLPPQKGAAVCDLLQPFLSTGYRYNGLSAH